MSKYEYDESRLISTEGYSFYALIMAAMRQADSMNVEVLRHAFPATHAELQARYNAPGGVIDGE